jgi:hypothetical protein
MKIEKHNIYWYFNNDLICEVRILSDDSFNGQRRIQTPFGIKWVSELKLHERK